VVYLEIGDRTAGDAVNYPDDDLAVVTVDGKRRMAHKDGTPYLATAAVGSGVGSSARTAGCEASQNRMALRVLSREEFSRAVVPASSDRRHIPVDRSSPEAT
jgi:hypothetical protein